MEYHIHRVINQFICYLVPQKLSEMLPDLCIDEKAVVILLFNRYPHLKILSLARQGDYYIVEVITERGGKATLRVKCSGEIPLKDRILLWMSCVLNPTCKRLLQHTLQLLLRLPELALRKAQAVIVSRHQKLHTSEV